jgi:hypothetical protein
LYNFPGNRRSTIIVSPEQGALIMAHIDRNISIHGLATLLGERFLYRKTTTGKFIVANKRIFGETLKHTATKKTYQEALREAAAHAAFSCTEELYANRATRTLATSYSMALIDSFGAPRVLEIDVDEWTGGIGETIRVKARDNINVAAVVVVIRAANGNMLEIGEAVQSEAGSPWWNYTTKSRVCIVPFPSVEAIAYDLAGNRDSFVTN